MKLNPRTPNLPKNESAEHFYLKQVAKIWLKTQKQCQYIASEVHVPSDKINGREKRVIVDTVGVRKIHKQYSSYDLHVYCIEVKVSKTDFANGFNTGGNFNYLLTPKGLLLKDEIPKGVGLLEVDIPKFKWFDSRVPRLQGLYVVKRPSKRNMKKENIVLVLDNITRKLTNEGVYKNPWVWREPNKWKQIF